MSLDRRNFLGTALAAALAGSFDLTPAEAQAMQHSLSEPPGNAAAFWNQFYSAHTGGAPQHNLFGGHANTGIEQDRQINFLNYDATKKTLRFPQEVAATELPDYTGDVSLSLQVGGIRLSQADRAAFQNLQSAQLRVDLAQNQTMENFNSLLAWASIASIFLGESKMLPTLQNLNFSPDSTKQVLLPGGSGQLGLNVSMTQNRGTYFTLLQKIAGTTAKFAPVMALPAVSITALAGVSQVLGLLENKTTFLFQTAAPEKIYATQAARQAANSSIGMNLVTGDYVAVPQQHVSVIQQHLDDYELQQGYLVPKQPASGSNQSVYSLADATLPDVSYLTLNLKVSPLINGAPSPDKITAPATSGGGGKPAAKPGTSTTAPPKKKGGGGGWI